MAKKHVFVCKSPDEENIPDPYVTEIRKRGFSCELIPVIDFQFCNLECLKIKLNHPELYSGIIFSSPRCVKAVSLCKPLKEIWERKLIFAVGESTTSKVANELNLFAEGGHTGNGSTLAPFILKRSFDLPLLIPCGNLSRDTLPKLLNEGGRQVDCVEVYKTFTNPNLERILRDAISVEVPEYVVYFSPSGVSSTLPLLKKNSLLLDTIKWVAIGPTTEDHLVKQGLKVACVAAKPNPKSLCEALESIVIS